MALFLSQTLLLVADITSFITFDETSQQVDTVFRPSLGTSFLTFSCSDDSSCFCLASSVSVFIELCRISNPLISNACILFDKFSAMFWRLGSSSISNASMSHFEIYTCYRSIFIIHFLGYSSIHCIFQLLFPCVILVLFLSIKCYFRKIFDTSIFFEFIR